MIRKSQLSENYFETIFNDYSSMILVLNSNREVLDINERSLKYLNKSKAECIGYQLGDLYSCTKNECHRCNLAKAISSTLDSKKSVCDLHIIFEQKSFTLSTTALASNETVLVAIKNQNGVCQSACSNKVINHPFFVYELCKPLSFDTSEGDKKRFIEKNLRLRECNALYASSKGFESSKEIIGQDIRELVKNEHELEKIVDVVFKGKNRSNISYMSSSKLIGVWGISVTEKVLIVSDRVKQSVSLFNSLTDFGYNVEVVSDLTVALSAVADRGFDIIFVDMVLGKKSNHEMIEKIQAANKDHKLIILTEGEEIEDVSILGKKIFGVLTGSFSDVDIKSVLEGEEEIEELLIKTS